MPSGLAAIKVKRWLLARALYRVKLFHLGEVPVRDRRDALRNLARAWAPFDACEYRMSLLGSQGFVWAWDAHQVESLLRDGGADLSAELVPEGLLRTPMASDGFRMLDCLEGFEAQAWIGGAVFSRWWPQMPTAAEWAGFLRNLQAPVNPPAVPPVLVDVPWQSKPWLQFLRLDAANSGMTRPEWLVASVVACSLVVLTAGRASEALGVQQLINARKAEIDRIRSSAAPVLASRDRAMLAAAESQALSKAMSVAQPIEVMRHLAEVLPVKGVTLREFELTGDLLRLGLVLAPDVQRSAVVKDLQSGAWLTGVTELREVSGRAWISFEMRLKGLAPPLAGPKPAASGPMIGAKP